MHHYRRQPTNSINAVRSYFRGIWSGSSAGVRTLIVAVTASALAVGGFAIGQQAAKDDRRTATPTSAPAESSRPTRDPMVSTNPAVETTLAAPPGRSSQAQSHALVGSADPPDGTPGQLAVVTHGEPDPAGSVPFVVRNNLARTAVALEVSATVTDSSGRVVGSGRSNALVTPFHVEPGAVAIGSVYFGYGQLGRGLSYQFTVRETEDHGVVVDLPVSEHGVVGDRVVGVATNNTADELKDLDAMATCFDASGRPTITTHESTHPDTLAVGERGSFQLATIGLPCVTYLVGATGQRSAF